jgi:hypothetical protein
VRRARIEVDGRAAWVDPDEADDDAVWLPPLEGEPSKIIATHLTYRSRAVEYAMRAANTLHVALALSEEEAESRVAGASS